RRQEHAVRAALGATQARLLSLAIVEGLVFASIGVAGGLILGGWALQGLLPLFAGSLPNGLSIRIDARAAVVIRAVGPALGALVGGGGGGSMGGVVGGGGADGPGARLADSLVGGARATAGRSASRIRSVLVVAQITLAVVLLSAAGLMLNSVARLTRVNPGFG